MQTFQNTVTIARPVGEVFAFLADLRNIPRWNYAIARTVPTSPGPAGAGATYRQTRTIPRRSEENLQITVFQPPTRLAVQGQAAAATAGSPGTPPHWWRRPTGCGLRRRAARPYQ